MGCQRRQHARRRRQGDHLGHGIRGHAPLGGIGQRPTHVEGICGELDRPTLYALQKEELGLDHHEAHQPRATNARRGEHQHPTAYRQRHRRHHRGTQGGSPGGRSSHNGDRARTANGTANGAARNRGPRGTTATHHGGASHGRGGRRPHPTHRTISKPTHTHSNHR